MKKPMPFINGYTFLVLLINLCLSFSSLHSQDIPIINPSLEGVPKINAAPPGWEIAHNSPDIQPGSFNIDLAPSDGKTYVGFHGGGEWLEGITQKLSSPLKEGRMYTISFDLAYTPDYSSLACYGAVAIYGSNSPGDTTELLWKSGEFTNTSWKRSTATLNPSAEYKYLSFWTYYPGVCKASQIGVAFVLDNISSGIREMPQISFSVKNTCKGEQSGIATVSVIGGEAPYIYEWEPGNYNTNRISGLASGEYKITVKAANGTSTSGIIQINESTLTNTVTITPSLCAGEINNTLAIETTGGQSPYRYYLNGSEKASSSSKINNLSAGNYQLIVQDDQGCQSRINNILIQEPAPLVLSALKTKSVSCSNVQDGHISLTPSGGTPPYKYCIVGYAPQTESVIAKLDEGQYHYRITDSHDCTLDGDATITKEWRDCAVFVPNAFSPNGDGLNDLFRAKVNNDVHNFHMAVYGRWGQLVFETADPERGWDGTQKGIGLAGGSYVWVITYTDSKQQNMKQQGSLVLVR